MSDWRQKADQDPERREEAHPLADKPEEAKQDLAQPHQEGLIDPELVGAQQGTNPEQIVALPTGDEQPAEAREEEHPLADKPEEAKQDLAQPHQQGLIDSEQIVALPAGDEQPAEAIEEEHPLADEPEEAKQDLAQPHQEGLIDPELVEAQQGTNPEQMHALPTGNEQPARAREEEHPLADQPEEAKQDLAQPHQQGLIGHEQIVALPDGDERPAEAIEKGNQTEPNLEKEKQGKAEQDRGNSEQFKAEDRQEVGPLPPTVEQEPSWNWTSMQDPSIRLFLLYECSYNHYFAIGSGAYYIYFEQLASTGSKTENVWVARILREALINQQPTLVLDVERFYSYMNFRNYWDNGISSKAEYSCLFFLRLDLNLLSYGSFPAKTESVFLRYARVILQQPDYLTVFPQLVAQTFESHCNITDIKPLYQLLNSYLREKPVDCWMTGCLLSILGMLGPNSEKYRYSLNLLIAADDFLIAQLQKTSESSFKTCLLRGLAHCIYWNLDNFEVVCRKMLLLFQQSTLSAEIELFLSGTVQKWSDLLLERFATMAMQLPNKLKVEVVKAWMLKQTEYMGICLFLAEIYPSLTDTAEIKTHVRLALGKIGKYMEPAEAEAILFLLKELPLGFTDILAESEIFGMFNNLIDRPVPAKIPLYSALLSADQRVLDSLYLKTFYKAALESIVDFPLSRVVSELNTCEATEKEILIAWRNNLPRPSFWTSSLDPCITTIDKDLASLPPALLPKFTAGAVDELLEITKRYKHDITTFAMSISSMHTQLFADMYAQKCVEEKLVNSLGDLMSQVRSSGSNRLLELLINASLTDMKVPTYTEIETQLFNSGDIDPVWKDILGQYETYKHIAFLQRIATHITTLAMKILQKDIEIKKLLWLQRKGFPLKKMTTTICLALVHTCPETQPTFHASVKGIVAEAAGINAPFDTLQVFLEYIGPELIGKTELCQELERAKRACQEVKLSNFALTGNLVRLLPAAELSAQYQNSELYKRYFATVKGSEPLTVDNVVQVCTSAEQIMLAFLSTYIPHITSAPVMTLVKTFQFQNWENEIAVIRRGRDWETQFDTLISLLKMYHASSLLLTHCKIIITISEAIFMSDPQFMEIISSFVQVSEQLATVTVESFMQHFQETRKVLYPEGVSQNEIEALGSLFRAPEMTEFLNGLTADKLEYMQECAEDMNPAVPAEVIPRLQQLWIFCTDLKKERQSYRQVMEFTRRKIKERTLHDLLRTYESCCQSLPTFKKLCTGYVDVSLGSLEPLWNWTVDKDLPFRIYFYFGTGRNCTFSLKWKNSSRNFTSQAIADLKDKLLWRIACSYEELQARPQFIVDTYNQYFSNTKQRGEQFTFQTDYSCHFLFSLKIEDGRNWKQQLSADLEISFLHYAKGILSHTSRFLREFPQLITQACALEKFQIKDSKRLYSFMDNLMNAKQLDLWRAGCLLAVLGLPGTFSNTEYSNSLTLLTMIDDQFIEQIRKTRETTFKTCIVQGVNHCVYWHLARTSASSQVLRNLIKERSLAPLTEQYMSDKMLTFEISELQPFLTILEDLSKPFQISVIKQAILKQTDYSYLFQLLGRAYHLQLTPTVFNEALQQVIRKSKMIKQVEVSELLSLLEGKTEEFKSLIMDSGIVNMVDKLLESPNPEKISFYAQLLVAEKRFVTRLHFDDFYKKMISKISLFRVLSELNPNENTEQQIITCWINTLPWTSRTSWGDPFPCCIQEIDAKLSTLAPQYFSKVAAKAADVLLFRMQHTHKNILTYVTSIDTMKAVEFREIFAMKCIEKNLVGDLNGLLNYRTGNKESFVLEKLVSATLGLATPPTYQEVETRFIYYEDLEESWKLLLEKYKTYKEFESAKSLVANIVEFGMSLLTKALQIKKILELKKKHKESLKKMTETIAQALRYTESDLADTYHAGVKQTLKAAAKVPMQLETLHTFLESIVPDLAEKPVVLQDLEQVKGTYLETKLASFVLPARLASLLNVAEIGVYYRLSEMFKKYLGIAKGDAALTLANVVTICTSAEQEMSNFLANCVPDVQTKPMATIVSAFSYADWKKEISLIGKRKDWEKHLLTLYYCLNLYHNRTKLIATSHLMLNMFQVIKLEDEAFKAQLVRFVRDLEEIGNVTVADFITSYETAKKVLQPEGQGEEAIEVLTVLLRSPELLEFLNGLTPSTIAYSLECVHDFESSVTVELIKELESVWIFYSELKQERKTYNEVIAFIKTKLKDVKYQGTVRAVQTCSQNLPAFEELKSNQEKKAETKRKQMEDIVNLSSTTFARSGLTFEISTKYKEGLKAACNLPTLSELKDRASLTLHSTKSAYDQQSVAVLSQFVAFVTEIQQVVELLLALKDSGYPRDVTTDKIFECRKGDFHTLRQYSQECRELLTHWSDSLETAYAKNYLLCYLYSSQFWTVEKYLTDPSDSSIEAVHLLGYIGKQSGQKSAAVPAEPSERLAHLGHLLSQLSNAECGADKINYEVAAEKRITNSPGVLYVPVEEKDFLRALLSVYFHTEGKVPRAHQVLFCSGTTEWAELLAFLYRCFTCPLSSEIYTLVGCEKLPLSLQTKFRNLFSSTLDRHIGTGNFSFAVITANNDCLLSEYFQYMEGPHCQHVRSSQLIESDEVLGKIIKQVDSRIPGSEISDSIVVISEMAGVGKSQWIRNQASGKPIVKFSIAGDMDLEQICRRLLRERLDNSPRLHLILSHVENTEILKDLLTYLIIFRSIRAGSLVAVIPRTCKMFIEVTNLHPSLMETVPVKTLPLLHYLTIHSVAYNTDDLFISPDTRFVCAYLDALSKGLLNDEDFMIESQPMTDRECKELLIDYFIEPTYRKNQEVTFASINSFVKSMKSLLRNFQHSAFSWVLLQEPIAEARFEKCYGLVLEFQQLRVHILQSLLQTVEELTTRCVKQVHEAQKLKSHKQEGAYECTVKWSDSNHFSMIFIEDGSQLAIYRKEEDVLSAVRKLIYLQLNITKHELPRLTKNIASGVFPIPNYSQMEHTELLGKLQTYRKGENLVDSLIHDSYVLTPDNFLKMNLIYLRALAGFPVIIMGETGCGKTSLVQFFIIKVLHEKLLIFNIHAGVTSTHLSAYVQQIIDTCIPQPSERFWVFFDEFNTSDTVGEISEILTERTYHGSILPANVVFVAACNPYRLRSLQLAGDSVGIKKSNRYKRRVPESLMHVVKPLPEPILEYLWDFGNLAPDDCRMYIGKMLERLDCIYLELFEELVWTAQSYFQQYEDVSSVSLRDVMRFTIFYKWYKVTLPVRTGYFSQKCEANCKKYKLKLNRRVLEDVDMAAGLLALCSCYYFRLSQKEDRAHLLSQFVDASNGLISQEQIYQVIEMNEYDIIARMELPKATALNQAFRENIACMVNCIFSKIPLFICGKPGCSKSLAIQLVFSNLKGDKSGDEFFRTLPELVMVPFQGSESSTSEGIEQVFTKAGKFLTQGVQLNLLPVVVFDEIGLAEISNHNPLKVLHSLLEQDTIAVGFVGVSNWRLDASKMNRAMYLARPDPDIEELFFTAHSILTACSQENVIEAYEEVVDAEAQAYWLYKQELKTEKDAKYEEFYGLRDFYSLIKQTSLALIERSLYDPREQFPVAKKAIERNFGGKIGAAQRMVQLLVQVHPPFEVPAQYTPNTPTINLINENLKDTRARFLLLLCKGDVATYAIEKALQLSSKERRTIIGSHMAEDESGEEYAFRALSDMILYLEKDISVILKDMDSIYTSLYDLFNQNFTVSGDRRYCRVALGAQFNPRCYVHDDFHVIVFVSDDEAELERIDAPFLNRFEKHRFSIEELFAPNSSGVHDALLKWKEDLFTLSWGKPVVISENHVFPLYSEEYLKLLVLFVQGTGQFDEMLRMCKEHLLKSATEEVLVLAHASVLDTHEKEFILTTWNSLHNTSFFNYLSHPCIEKKSLVFTYDPEGLLDEKHLPDPSLYVVQHFSVFKCERDLVHDLDSFYNNGSKSMYILNFSLSKNSKHLAMVKFTFERKAKESEKPNKRLLLLVQMKRNENIEAEVCWFENWDIQSFGLLRDNGLSVKDDLLGKSYAELFVKEEISLFDEEIGRMLKDAYDTILFRQGKLRKVTEKATASDPFIATAEDINKSIFKSIETISESPDLIAAFRRKVHSLMQTKEGSWVEKVLCSADCISRAANLQKAVSLAVEAEAAQCLTQVVFEAEKWAAMRGCWPEGGEVLRKIWVSEFDALVCVEPVSMAKQSNALDFSILLSFPFITKEKAFLETAYPQICASTADSAAIETAFQRRFEEQSIIRHEIYGVTSPFQALYLREFLYLDLVDKDYLFPQRHVLLAMQTCIAAEKGSIAGKVLSYVQHREFCLTVCEVVALAKDLVQDVSASFISSFQDLEANVVNIFEGEKQPTTEEEDPNEESTYMQEIKKSIARHICSIISDVVRTCTNSKAGKTITLFSLDLSRFFDLATKLNATYRIDIDGESEAVVTPSSALCIWTRTLALLSSASEGQVTLEKVLRKTSGIEYLFDPDVVIMLCKQVDKSCKKEEALRYKAIYYTVLLRNVIPNTVQLIKTAVNGTGDFWKFATGLIKEVVEMRGLLSEAKANISENLAQNEYQEDILDLETALTDSMDTNFAVMISDELAAAFLPSPSSLTVLEAEERLAREEANFEAMYALALNPPTDYTNIQTLYAHAYMRIYYEYYCKVVREDTYSLPSTEDLVVKARKVALQIPAVEIYILKYLGEDARSLCHTKSALTWANYHFERDEYTTFLPRESREIFYSTMECLDKGKSLGSVITGIETPRDKFAFGLAFYVSELGQEKRSANAFDLLQAEMDHIVAVFGLPLSRLLYMFATSFPQGSVLEINPETSPAQRQMSLILSYYLLTVLAYSSTGSALTAPFLDTSGNVHPDITQIAETALFVGTRDNPIYLDLKSLQNRIKAKDFVSTLLQCSTECLYIYIDSQEEDAIKQCPICRSPLGRQNGELIERPGHQEIDPEQAIEALNAAFDVYSATPLTGCWLFPPHEEVSFQGLDPASSRLLSLFTATLIYYLHLAETVTSGQIPIHSLCEAGEPMNLLSAVMLKEMEGMEEFVGEDGAIWWLSLISELPTFMGKSEEERNVPLSRRAFELTFQENTLKWLHDKEETIKDIRERSRLELTTVENLLKEAPETAVALPHLSFYRLKAPLLAMKIESDFQTQELGHVYPLMNLCLKYQKITPELELFPLLLDLTKSLYDQFNRRIRREAARKMTIGRVLEDNQRLRGVYLKAVELWTTCSNLNSVYHVLQGEDTDTLAAFLLDRKDGSQLVTVLQLLAALNNSILAEFCEIQKARNRPYSLGTPVPLEDVQSSQLLFLSLASFSTTDIYLVNPAYGKGVEVVCNYAKLEEAVIRRFENPVQIDQEQINFIQYQFELLSAESQNQHLIERIRTQHIQREFTPDEKKIVTDAFTKRESETSDQHKAHLLPHIEQLESLMCLLIRSEPVANVTIQQFAKQYSGYRASPLFTTENALTALSLELIVAVYQQLEVEFFPYAKQLLSPEFRQEEAGLVDSLHTLRFEEIPSTKELVLAVMRLILRVLLASVECSQPISQYITRADLWAVTVNKEAVEHFARVLDGKSLGISLQLYEGLHEMCAAEEKQAITTRVIPAASNTKAAKKAGRRGPATGFGNI